MEMFVVDKESAGAGRLPRDIPENDLAAFAAYVAEHSGLVIEREKWDTLRISLHARASKLGLKSYQEYLELIKTSEFEFRELLSLITINETYFFRYPEQFDVLQRIVLPAIREEKMRKGDRKLRLWSAGCSTGEEAFTLAICVLEAFPDYREWDIEVLGTDVSKKALQAAMIGEYGRNSFRIVRDDIRERYFSRVSSDVWTVRREVREITDFMFHNLIKEPYPYAFLEAWDIIFCRNVTIYFNPESTRRVIENFFRSLVPGGYLFVGHSETLYNMNPGFEVVRFGDVFVYQKPERALDVNTQRNATAPRGKSGETRETKVIKSSTKSDAHDGKPKATKHDARATRASASAPREIDAHEARAESLLPEPEANLRTQLKEALALIDADRLSEAAPLVDELVARNPLSAEAHYLKGLFERKAGRLTEALEFFKKSAYLDSDFGPSFMEAGNVLCELGKYEQAIKYYQTAAETLKKTSNKQFLDFAGEEVLVFLQQTCAMMIAKLKEALRAGKGGA